MPTNYNGSSVSIAPRQTVTIAEPNGSDPRNAASVATPLEQLANVVAYLMERAVLNGNEPLNNLNAGRIQFTPGFENEPLLESVTARPADQYQEVGRFPINSAGTTWGSIYAYSGSTTTAGGLALVLNATWGGSAWAADIAFTSTGNERPLMLQLDGAGGLKLRRSTATTGSAGDAVTWSDSFVVDRNGLEHLPTAQFHDSSGVTGNTTAGATARAGRLLIGAGSNTITVTHPGVTTACQAIAWFDDHAGDAGSAGAPEYLGSCVCNAGSIEIRTEGSMGTGRYIGWKLLHIVG